MLFASMRARIQSIRLVAFFCVLHVCVTQSALKDLGRAEEEGNRESILRLVQGLLWHHVPDLGA